jgi:hypothetical protein
MNNSDLDSDEGTGMRGTRGLAAVRWSRGLRQVMLGPDAGPELADEELAAADINGRLVAIVAREAWSRIRLARLDHACWSPPSPGTQLP